MKKPISADDLYALINVESPALSPDGRYLAFVRADVSRLGNKVERHIWLVDLAAKAGRPRQFTYGAKSDFSPAWAPDSQTLAFVSTRADRPQIYLISVAGGEARPLTQMPNGATGPVWSPDGARLAFVSSVNAEERAREDAGQPEPPPADALEARHRDERQAEAEKKKSDPRVITQHPYRTGTEYLDDRHAHIYVIAPAGEGAPHRLTDGDLDFNDVAWVPDGTAIISTQSRDPEHEPYFKHRALVRIPVLAKGRKPYRLLTGEAFEYFGPRVSPNGKWIAATRVPEEESWGREPKLVVVPTAGGPARELTTDFDRAVGGFAWAADSRSLVFGVNDRGDTHLYRVAVATRAIHQVVGGRRMVAEFDLDRAGRVAFTASTPARPSDLYLAGPDGRGERRLTDFNDAWLAERELAQIEERWHTAPDGRRIQGWLMKPVGFQKGRRYPLVLNMHGGPWVMWGPSMPAVWLEWQLHAARGYAVYFCNPRGSEGYGEEHAMLIRNDWGDHVMHDILTGLDQVVAQGFVDPKRMAVTGGSYAGYMTAWIISHDQRFACAWAQRGLYNITSFFGTTDVPQLIEKEFEVFGFDDIGRLWRQSPLAYVRNIRTPLAIEHQDNDWRCPPSEAEQLFTALKRLKREVVLIRYPREGHEMSRSGEPQHRVDRLNRQVAWFDKYCRPRAPRRR